jgi:hypothetical protein
MSDQDQVWNAFISAMPAQDKARHDLQNFQAKLLKNALQEIEDQTLEIISLGAQIVKLTELLNEVNAICRSAIEDRDRFRDDWKAMAKDLSRWRPA